MVWKWFLVYIKGGWVGRENDKFRILERELVVM